MYRKRDLFLWVWASFATICWVEHGEAFRNGGGPEGEKSVLTFVVKSARPVVAGGRDLLVVWDQDRFGYPLEMHKTYSFIVALLPARKLRASTA